MDVDGEGEAFGDRRMERKEGRSHRKRWGWMEGLNTWRWFLWLGLGVIKTHGSGGMSPSSNTVHVALCPSPSQTQGMLVAIRSVRRSCEQSEAKFHFHVITLEESVPVLQKSLSCFSDLHAINYTTYALDPSLWPAHLSMHVRNKFPKGYALDSPLNFARFFMDRILPWEVMHFEKVFYVDTDCVVQSCLAPIYWNSLMRLPVTVAAATRKTKISRYAGIDLKHPKIVEWNELHTHKINNTLVAFNAGFLLVNLKRWQEEDVLQDIIYWIEANSNGFVYNLGSNPPLVLGLAGRVEYLEGAWNVDGLGYRRHMPSRKLVAAKVLHWTGPKKPWNSNALPEYQKLWQPLRQPECE